MEKKVEKIIEIIAEELDLEKEKVTLNSQFTRDLNADSLDVIQIIMRLENMFEITISDEDAMDIKTVGDAVEKLKKVVR